MERVDFGSPFEDAICQVGAGMKAGHEGACHSAHSQHAQRDDSLCPFTVSFLLSLGPQPLRWCHSS